VLALVDADLLEGLEGVPLFEEELVVIAPLDHPLARTKRVRVERLSGEPLVTYPAPRAAALPGLAPG
jgi:DNA-binding transcriptional LysR family regulator